MGVKDARKTAMATITTPRAAPKKQAEHPIDRTEPRRLDQGRQDSTKDGAEHEDPQDQTDEGGSQA
jgi:hypothetical protein